MGFRCNKILGKSSEFQLLKLPYFHLFYCLPDSVLDVCITFKFGSSFNLTSKIPLTLIVYVFLKLFPTPSLHIMVGGVAYIHLTYSLSNYIMHTIPYAYLIYESVCTYHQPFSKQYCLVDYYSTQESKNCSVVTCRHQPNFCSQVDLCTTNCPANSQ